MNLKRKIATSLALCTTIVGFGATATPALANNHGDTHWTNHFHYSLVSPNDHTPARPKYDRSYMYMKTTDGNIGYQTVWAATKSNYDVSDGHSYRSYVSGDPVFLYNMAVERYGSGVYVRINCNSFSNGWAAGWWSPDSV